MNKGVRLSVGFTCIAQNLKLKQCTLKKMFSQKYMENFLHLLILEVGFQFDSREFVTNNRHN